MKSKTIISVVICLFFFKMTLAQEVISTNPAQNAINVNRNTTIKVQFDSLMNGSSFNNSSFVVNGLRMGLISGSLNYTDTDTSVTFTPLQDFCAGEIVTVVLTKDIKTINGTQPGTGFAFSFTSASNNGSGIFAPKVDYETGGEPSSIISADFDRDNDLDFASANHISNTVSIFFNDGNGTFTNKANYETTHGTTAVFSADLNSDSALDLAVTGESNDIISILLNKGNGSFDNKIDYETGNDPVSIFLVDLDSDGDMDLTTANEGSNSTSVLLNNGIGTFAIKSDYLTGSAPRSIFSADIDSDGEMDLSIANRNPSNTVSILLNIGDGTFPTKNDYLAGNGPYSVSLADFDKDSDLDLAVAAYYAESRVSILFNDGNGAFSNKIDYNVGIHPHSVFSADFNSDGDIDIVVANCNSNTISILLNNGDGTFADKADYGVGESPVSVFSADFDNDGDMDLAVANSNSNTVSILLNRNTLQDINFSSNSHNFGSAIVDASKTWDLKIYNTGVSGNLEISNITSGTSYFTVDTTSGTIEPDSSLTVSVTFTPTSIGNYSDSLCISSNDPYDPIVYVYLSGICGTFVSGEITEDTTWTKAYSPYIVTGNLTINPDVTLNIDPGVEVKFDGYYSITVNGNLLINGTSDENVLFTSVYEPYPGNWNRIHFSSTGSGNLNYLTLNGSSDGIYAENANSLIIHNSLLDKNSNYGIYLNSTSATIKNTTIINNGTGIYGISSSPEIDYCTISDNTINGLYFSNNTSSPIITNSIIIDNKGYGIYYSNGNGQIKIKDNEITGNTNWGVYIEEASSGTEVKYNTIKTNGGGLCSHTYTFIENNTISENNGDGIYATNSSITIKYNRIKDNTGDGIETIADIAIDQNYIAGNKEDGIKAISSPVITYNEINNNTNDGIETSGLPAINYNNFSDNTGYDLKATKPGTQTINAENNYWGTANENNIKSEIWDYDDDGTIVKVDYSPYYNNKVELLPVSGFTAQTLAGGKIKLSWNTHILASQYLLYHDNLSGVIDTTSVWISLDSTYLEYTVTLSDGEYKLGIIAQDNDGRKSPLDSCLAKADGTPPTLLSLTGNTGQIVITATFSENTDYTLTENIDNWTLSGGLTLEKIKAGDFWTTKTNMPTPRGGLAVGIINGKLYAVGGGNVLEVYDPDTDTWTTRASMPTSRGGLAVGVINEKLYAIGGNDLSTVEEYDPVTDMWTTKANMPTAREWFAVGVINKKLYAIGGRYQNNPLSTVEEYDPMSDTWITKTSMPDEIESLTAAVIKGKLYAVGGGYSLEQYDPLTDEWTRKANMITGRRHLAAGVINNKIYAVGGWEYMSTLEEYDPVTDTWTTRANMPTPRGALATGVIKDKLYVVGGSQNNELSTVEVYTFNSEEIILSLATGQVLPSPVTQITVTCNNIKDIYGNQAGSQTDTVIEQLNITSDYSEIICPTSNNGYIDISVSGGTPPYSYSWSNDSTTQDINNLGIGSYEVTVTDDNNFSETQGFLISQANPYQDEEICLVTVNEANKNIIIWEKTPDKGIVLYNIYRETIEVGVYELLGTVPYENLSVFIDTTSNPNQRSYQYKLSLIDTCGNESDQSYYHRTMLLKVNVGIGAYNLDWDDYEYEGGGFTFSKFNIYRGPSEDSLQVIDSIGANYFTYIDNNPPEGLLYYQVAGVKPDGCFPAKKKKSISSENYTLSFTNIEDNGATGIGDINFTDKIIIYPNPFTNKTTIEFPNPNLCSYKLIITHISGKTVRIIENIKTNKIVFEKGVLSEGFYLIELRGEKVYRGRFVID